MKQLNTYFLFYLGQKLADIDKIDMGHQYEGILGALAARQPNPTPVGNRFGAARTLLNAAEGLLRFVSTDTRLNISKELASDLVDKLIPLVNTLHAETGPDSGLSEEAVKQIRDLQKEVTKFVSILEEELARLDIYYVQQTAGFNTSTLIESGEVVFPDELKDKVPQAMFDVKQGTRCLAFELWTASAFHFHRANESVVHVYFDHVTNKAQRPDRDAVGDYLDALDKLDKGSKEVRASLRDLNKLHRNPHVHPDHNIESMHEAVALMNAVHNAIYQMLKSISVPFVLTQETPTSGD